jgi:hypothetical protein
MKTKINTYWKNNGTKVRSHTRGLKTHKNAPKRIVASNRGIKRVLWFVAILIGISWFCSTIEISFTDPNVKAEELPTITNVDPEKGFESADMSRDTIDRDGRTIEDKIRKVFGKEADNALKIVACESGGNPTALGDTNTKYPSAGLFQIRLLPERGITKEQMFNVDENINYAKMLFDKTGTWRHWSCRGVIK